MSGIIVHHENIFKIADGNKYRKECFSMNCKVHDFDHF